MYLIKNDIRTQINQFKELDFSLEVKIEVYKMKPLYPLL